MTTLDHGRARTLLVLSPHPDDAELGAGAALIHARNAGWRTIVAVVSDGRRGLPAGADPTLRRREQASAAGVLGARLSWLGFADAGLPCQADLVGVFRALIRSSEADLVLAPWPRDAHQDHRAVSDAALSATRGGSPALRWYCTPTSHAFDANAHCEIDDAVFALKRLAVAAHASQMARADRRYMEWLDDTARFFGHAFCAARAEPYHIVHGAMMDLTGALPSPRHALDPTSGSGAHRATAA